MAAGAGGNEYEPGLGARIAVILADRGCPLRNVCGRTRRLAAHEARWRTPVWRKPVARADGARSRPRYTPDPGPAGPGTAASAAAHAPGHRSLVLIVHRIGTRPRQARPAHTRVFPGRPSPA